MKKKERKSQSNYDVITASKKKRQEIPHRWKMRAFHFIENIEMKRKRKKDEHTHNKKTTTEISESRSHRDISKKYIKINIFRI